MTNEDLRTIEAMKKYGGGFVKALAEAALLADSENLERIKRVWPNYWLKYEDMAEDPIVPKDRNRIG